MLKNVAAVPVFLMLVLIAGGCASTIQVKGPIPPMERVDAMTAFLGEQFGLDDVQLAKVREVVKTSAVMKKTIHEMVREGRVDLYQAERQRMNRFSRELGAILNDEQRKMLKPVVAEIRRGESDQQKKWRDTNPTPMVGGIGR